MFENVIIRKIYQDRLAPFINKNIIKVLIGQRRVGKSFLMRQVANSLINDYDVSEERIIYINKELYEFDNIKNHHDLVEYVNQRISSTEKHYIFIDEIQEIENYENGLRDFYGRDCFDIYCTGSNANILSSEISSKLSGRYIEIRVNSLIYSEFLEFHGLKNSSDSLKKFIRFGGMPYLFNLKLTDDVVFEYLKNIFNTIVLKDIVARYSIRNINFLERLIFFLADNTGQLVSAKRISDFLKSQRINISPNIVLNYLSFLADVFFVNRVRRMDLKGKKIFEVNDKFYFTDLGIRHSIIGYKANDISKILENVVYTHLISTGHNVYVGEGGDFEVDFICEINGKRKYVQVCYMLEHVDTVEREFGNLLKINDNYEKIVVSMDELFSDDYKGVKHKTIANFLMETD